MEPADKPDKGVHYDESDNETIDVSAAQEPEDERVVRRPSHRRPTENQADEPQSKPSMKVAHALWMMQ